MRMTEEEALAQGLMVLTAPIIPTQVFSTHYGLISGKEWIERERDRLNGKHRVEIVEEGGILYLFTSFRPDVGFRL